VQLAKILYLSHKETNTNLFSNQIFAGIDGLFLHVDMLSVECWFPNVTFVSRLVVFLVALAMIFTILVLRKRMLIEKLSAERKKFFTKRKELDMLSNNLAPPADNPSTLRQKHIIRLYTLKVRNSTRHMMIFLTIIQIPLLHHFSNLFKCVVIEKNQFALEIDTRIMCGESNLWLDVIRYTMLALLCGTMLATLAWLQLQLWRMKKSNSLSKCENLDRFGHSCEVFKLDVGWWFGVVVILRRLCCGFVLSFEGKLYSANNSAFLFTTVNCVYGALLFLLRPYDWKSSKQYLLLVDLTATGVLIVMGWAELSGEGR